ncbi:alpha/beta hydrolase family protein [Nocardia sp. NPDC020380]|uniref:alpha/beta hydrolase family protein n=1 Tax=Nocardia sp. NPDC020380 TaxID=3364309 RepID=UPI00379983A3
MSIGITSHPFHIQSAATVVRDGFPYAAHHDSVSALWSSKWRTACAAGIYPFTDGRIEDFEPIFAELIRTSADDPDVLYRPDDYARPFLPVADRLETAAQQALSNGDTPVARGLFLRAAAVYRIARFPINRSPLSGEAWEKGKAAYEQAGRLLDPPSIPVDIPFTHADTSAGDLDAGIPAYLRLPLGPRPAGGWPVLLFVCGLDGYRTDQTPSTQVHVERGYATVIFEIPGTGDCPAAPNDPAASDRLLSSVLDWVAATAAEHGFDPEQVLARGVSTGGYHVLRAAHTHAERLVAVVAHGGGCHHMFDPDWITAQNQMEYPFALSEALACKFGYRDPDPATAVARYRSEAKKFSLADSGVLDTPSCKVLLINGMEDSIFPIEDSILAATRGRDADLVALGGRPHMGNPDAEAILYDWIDKAVTGKP